MKLFNNRRRNWLMAFVAIGLAIAVWPTYHWWVAFRTESYRESCESARDAEDWEQLERSARDWLSWDGENGDAWIFLATAAQEQGDHELAAECIDKIPDDHPRILEALDHRMMTLMALNRVLEAEATAKRIIRIQPYAGRAHKLLIFIAAISLQRLEVVRRAREAIDRECEPRSAYVYICTASSLSLSNGTALTNAWQKQYPNDETLLVASTWYRVNMGGSSAGGAKPDELFDPCRKKFPGNPEVLAYDLQRAVADGRVERVAELLSTATKRAESDSRVWQVKGWYHARKNELANAAEAYRQALKLDPYNWPARHEWAAVLRRQSKTQEAERAAKLALLGKKIEKEMIKLKSADEIPGELLKYLADYARVLGDEQVYRALSNRLNRRA